MTDDPSDDATTPASTATPTADETGAELACPHCSAPFAAGDHFCEACGGELPSTDAPPPEAEVAGGERATDASAPVAIDPDPEVPLSGPRPQHGAPATVSLAACGSCGGAGGFADGYCLLCGAKAPAPRDHIEQSAVGVGAVTDRGRRHHRNEDAMAFASVPGAVVAVVCDGVSSTVRPDDASQAAVDTACAALAAGDVSQPDHDAAYLAAREAVLAVDYEPQVGLGPPSCTYLAAVVTADALHVAALGDCRAYWVEGDGTVRQLTVDDSWGTMQVQAGEMTPEQAYSDPRAHAISRWIARDADPTWRPAKQTLPVTAPGRLLLVSDGYWNYAVDDDAVAAHLRDVTGDPLSTARRLVEIANEAGGSDNITVVVIEVPAAVSTPEADQGGTESA